MTIVSTTAEYPQGTNLPDLELWWLEPDGSGLIDFDSGWTITADVGRRGQAAEFNATGCTGATGSGDGTGSADVPNVVLAWASSGELKSLAAGSYVIEFTATRLADSKVRKLQIPLKITSEVLAPS